MTPRSPVHPEAAFIRRALIWTTVGAIALVVLASSVIAVVVARAPAAQRLDHLKVLGGLLKSLVVGAAITVLGVLVPAALTAAKEEFGRRKESRREFSAAQTGVDYLPIRLCSLELTKAAALIQRVHVHKHQAQLYADLDAHLARRGDSLTAEEWGDEKYEMLRAMRGVLEKHASTWNGLRSEVRLKEMIEASATGKQKAAAERRGG